MNIKRIIELNKLLNEADNPEFDSFRKRLEVIFKNTADFYKKAASDLEPEIRDVAMEDHENYMRLSRLAKSAKQNQIASAWKKLDMATRETVYDFVDKKEKKQFIAFMKG